MTSVKELLNKVQEVLVKQTNPLAIILFGSKNYIKFKKIILATKKNFIPY